MYVKVPVYNQGHKGKRIRKERLCRHWVSDGYKELPCVKGDSCFLDKVGFRLSCVTSSNKMSFLPTRKSILRCQ